jgi:hypothetical protein
MNMAIKESKKIIILVITVCCLIDISLAKELYNHFADYGLGPIPDYRAKSFGGIIIALIFANYFLYHETKALYKVIKKRA